MKLLHLNAYYAVVGGLERYLGSVCGALEAAGHATAVVHAEATGHEPRGPRPAYHVPGLGSPRTPPTGQALARLRAILEAEAPDVVVVHEGLHERVAALATGAAPSVRWAHDFRLLCPGRSRTWARSGVTCTRAVGAACQAIAWRERCMPRNPARGFALIRRTRRLAALHRRHSEVVVASAFMRGVALADGFAPDRVHVVPYFTDAVADVSGDPVPGRLLCVGRLVPEKGVAHLLDAVRHLAPPAHLVIVGEGEQRAALADRARAVGLGARVVFAGWREGAALAAAYREAEIVVVPSTWPEPFGIVGIEAMAHARPVVASDVGGVRQWLRPDETGLPVPPRDPQALAAAIATLRERPELRARFGAEGRRVVAREFLADTHVQRLLRVAEAAVAGRGARTARGA
jgi:glycosyltransferase involved in cell wall biosynthesis